MDGRRRHHSPTGRRLRQGVEFGSAADPNRRAAQQVGAKGLVLGGGVAANSVLRERFLSACVEDGIRGFLPSRAMCTDNAAMVAAAGWRRLAADGASGLDTGADPNLRLPLLAPR